MPEEGRKRGQRAGECSSSASSTATANTTTTADTTGTEKINPRSIVVDDVPEVPKKRGRKKKEKIKTDNNLPELNTLIQSIFSIISLKAGSHWNITQEEANSISVPLANILNKYNILDKANNVSDILSLSIALGIILIPRILVTQAMNKNKSIEGDVKKDDKKGEINKNNIGTIRQIQSSNGNTGKFIKAYVNELY